MSKKERTELAQKEIEYWLVSVVIEDD